jgi:hypothetical protein
MLGLYAVDVGMKPAPGTHGLICLKTSRKDLATEVGSSIFQAESGSKANRRK